MNSEELEQSLRTEFEIYLKNVVSDLKNDILDFQKSINTQFEQHKAHIDEAFESFSSRFDKDFALDEGFKDSVVEHLRLSKDEGAKITAAAFADAEELEHESRVPLDYGAIKEAIDDISSKDSQASILKALIANAENFATRGAFFIIKNEHLVGWKVFGRESESGEAKIRDIHFAALADTILGKAVLDQNTIEGAYGNFQDDDVYLEPLGYGRPDRMYAIPLVARGKSVAVLYADYGTSGTKMDSAALEVLVRVAGLTVEMHATAKAVRHQAEDAASAVDHHESADSSFTTPVAAPAVDHHESAVSDAPETETAGTYTPSAEIYGLPDQGYEYKVEKTAEDQPAVVEETEVETDVAPEHTETAEKEYSFETPSYELPKSDSYLPSDPAPEYDPYGTVEVEKIDDHHVSEVPAFGAQPSGEVEREIVQPGVAHSDSEVETSTTESAFVYESPVETEAPAAFEPSSNSFESNPYEAPSYEPVASGFESTSSFTAPVDPEPAPVEAPSAPSAPRGRLSDRQVDLPIEVAEDERRLHNDARRFARLLVSEIKLYNEKKVQEGRESSDLYHRLKEAIDRSREMYDKRVQTPVSQKFDYFHFELVNSLADGDESKLGPGYTHTGA